MTVQTTQFITETQLDDIVQAIYAEGTPVVKEAYSELDSHTVVFASASDLRAHIQFVPGQRAFFQYAIHYPDAKGFVLEKRIELNPDACQGHSYRYSQEGWGLIFLQIGFQDHARIDCRVTTNSSARATTWFDTYPQLQSPDLWNWKEVNRHAGRLVRLLRKLGKQSQTVGRAANKPPA